MNEALLNSPLIFFVNGKKIVENNPDPEQLLVSYLRESLHLTGTKIGCSEGGCGACTVMVSKYNRTTKKVEHYAVVACLTPLCSMHGLAITTVEGIGSIAKNKLHPVQERLAKAHGLQCGFCTPGIVMSMYALLRNNPNPEMCDLEKTFQGNLCRCTGYRPIIEGFRTFTKEHKAGLFNACPMGTKCCKISQDARSATQLFDDTTFAPYDPSQEIIFPPELKENDCLDTKFVIFNGKRVTWYRPVTMSQLLMIKKKIPEAKIVAGNTEIWLEMQQSLDHYRHLISTAKISEMNQIKKTNDGIQIGANVTLNDLENILKKECETSGEHETRLYQGIIEMLRWFSGAQIRNVATAVGNIMTSSPISDLNPIFLVGGVKIEVVSSDDRKPRYIQLDSNFFTGYRKNILSLSDIILSITLPKTSSKQFILAYKQSKRRDDDITIVSMAMNVVLNSNLKSIDHLCVAFGGVGSTLVIPFEKSLNKKSIKSYQWDKEFLDKSIAHLSEYFNNQLKEDAPGGEVEYRKALVLSLFYKAFLSVSAKIGKNDFSREICSIDPYKTPVPLSSQLFEIPSEAQSDLDPIGRPELTVSAFKHTTGESIYCDDFTPLENELHLALVFSTKAHAKIKQIDASKALEQMGVKAFYCSKDIPSERNSYTLALSDEHVFADEKVECYGQVVGAIVAESRKLAIEASKVVLIDYEELQPILTLEEAIEHGSFYPDYPIFIEHGDINKIFQESHGVLEGSFRTGKQEHFYIEPHAVIAVPKDSDEMEIFSSTQWPQKIQKEAARLLDISESRVNVRVKRIGGGFGGKESKGLMIALPTVWAAQQLNQPVRCVLERADDMISTGTRNPFIFQYKVGFSKDGYLLGLEVKVWINAGCTMDFSCAVLERAMMHVQNAYNIQNVKVSGWVCRTNTVSNTVFRGSGSPQATMMAEKMMREVASALQISYVDLVDKNLYREGHLTFYNQKILNCNVERCFRECLQMSDYEQRRKTVCDFNSANRWKKRGISILPTMFGAGFVPVFLNQAGALVHVYTDGSVLLSHGGVEIGQGLHTKMIQIASRVLEIPMEKIHISETATDKVPNATTTSASCSSDLNGMAVLDACNTIKNRLTPYRKKHPNEKWESWVSRAYLDRVSLSATGFFKQTDIGYDWKTNQGNAWYYFVFGAACCEVEIDCLTGDHHVRRVDIVMDLGSSINPAIDIGQVEGAFIQGYGFLTMEEILYSPEGQQLTKGPSTYKIPGFNDIPHEFYVSLLTGAPNPRAVYSSKAVGEPPLHLSAAVFFAIREAIIAARKEESLTDSFEFNVPATAARIRMACQDSLTKKASAIKINDKKGWSISV